MVVVEIFCFWFSVRLGSIIIGIFTSLQCSALLVMYGLWMESPEEYTTKLFMFLNNFHTNNEIVNELTYDLQIYSTPFGVLITILLVFSLLLIFASFKCKPALAYPFLIIYPLYTLLLLTCHIFIMLILKNQEAGIGDLILYSNVGGFIILFLMYMWVCVLSFVQILHELHNELKEKAEVNKIDFNPVSMITSTTA